MSDVTYINTQEIRKDLHGFLKKVESGREVVVLNRSKVISHLNHQAKPAKKRAGMTAAERRQWLDDLHRTAEQFSFKSDRKYTREEMNER